MSETYRGPSTLREALDAATPHPETGVRLAKSTPNGSFIAVLLPDGTLLVRDTHRMSGQAGSVAETGRWLTEAETAPTLQWRPV